MVVTTGFFSIYLSGRIDSIRQVEFPMERSLREAEVSIWEAVHAADAYRNTADELYADMYLNQVREVEDYFRQYAVLSDTPTERAAVDEFDIAWNSAVTKGHTLLSEVLRLKEKEELLFQIVDEADHILDFEIQEVFNPNDRNLMEKERAVREVEVSIWEAIHAVTRYSGLTRQIGRKGHAEEDFAQLMEAQFDDVELFWAKYKVLATSESEVVAINRFETSWRKAKIFGRSMVALENQATKSANEFNLAVGRADQIIDEKMQPFIAARVEARDESSRTMGVALIVGILGTLGAILAGLFYARSAANPIRKLQDALVELANGNLEHEVGIEHQDEYAELAKAFYQLSEQLSASKAEIAKESKGRLKAESDATLAASRAAEATLSSEAKSRFLAVMSHEIRTPLIGVLGMAGFLAESDLDGEQRSHVDILNRSGNALLELVNDILDFSANEAGELSLNEENFDLKDLVDDVYQLMIPNARQKGIELITDYAVDCPARFVGDPIRIRQIVMNTVSNGIKFTSKGSVRIEVEHVSRKKGESNVSLTIQDSGIGIEAEDQKRMFTPFEQIDGSSTRSTGGVGLGLAIIKQLVDAMKGEIEIDSTPGRGTAFRMILPMAVAKNKRRAPRGGSKMGSTSA